jgi:hypothetical protein
MHWLQSALLGNELNEPGLHSEQSPSLVAPVRGLNLPGLHDSH